jgi:hypothetical protein
MAKRGKKAGSKTALSPLMRSAFEVLEHGLYHYLRSSTPKDMKFAILHIDQAVELFLKERIRKGGKSINKPKNPKETITIWQAYEILEDQLKVSIPEKTDLELLHEERNNIQHKYANPSADDAEFYVDNAMKFIERFVREELKLTLADFISSEYLSQVL